MRLSFEANQGQTDPRVRFLARGGGYTIFLTGTEAVLALREQRPKEPRAGLLPARFPEPEDLARQAWQDLIPPRLRDLVAPSLSALVPADSANPEPRIPNPEHAESASVLVMKLVGGNAKARVVGLDELPGRSNYFIGNDPKKWRTNVPNYAQVKYQNVYPGVDLVYYGNQRQLEYDFVVEPGADPKQIKLSFAGADGMRVDPASGDLVVKLGDDEVRFQKPAVYQPTVAAVYDRRSAVSDRRRRSQSAATKELDGTFILAGNNEAAFRVAAYDPSKPLIIDPVLSYSTYLGGSARDQGYGIATDSAGSAYVTGLTESTDFPTASPLQGSYAGGTCGMAPYTYACPDVFVTKLNPSGSALVYSTYLGGSGADEGWGIAVDAAGNAYVTGRTYSADFPTANPLQATCGGCSVGKSDAFVAKLNAAGSALVYSTYLGGSNYDEGNGIAVDSAGNAYVTGTTLSTDFPTANPLQGTCGGCSFSPDAFVSKLNPAGSALVYSTYLGGSRNDYGTGVAVDGAGNAYVTGWTDSTDFPTANPLQAACGGCFVHYDAFVAKLNPAGSALVYSTYLGGSRDDEGYGIAADAAGNAYVTGRTYSADFPTANPFQANCDQCEWYNWVGDAFVSKLNPAGSALVYSTYLGGSRDDYGVAVAVDAGRNAYVTGGTYSTDFPTAKPVQPKNGGGIDAFVAKLNPAGSALVYSTYLGGRWNEVGSGIAVDAVGNAYVTGMTLSTDFPTANPLQAGNAGVADVFVAKIAPVRGPEVILSRGTLVFGPQPFHTTSAPETLILRNLGSAPMVVTAVTPSASFGQTNTCGNPVPVGSSCTISVTFTPGVLGLINGTLTIEDNAFNVPSPQTVHLFGFGIPKSRSRGPVV